MNLSILVLIHRTENNKTENTIIDTFADTIALRDKLDFRIAQGIRLGLWSKVPSTQLEFIKD